MKFWVCLHSPEYVTIWPFTSFWEASTSLLWKPPPELWLSSGWSNVINNREFRSIKKIFDIMNQVLPHYSYYQTIILQSSFFFNQRHWGHLAVVHSGTVFSDWSVHTFEAISSGSHHCRAFPQAQKNNSHSKLSPPINFQSIYPNIDTDITRLADFTDHAVAISVSVQW